MAQQIPDLTREEAIRLLAHLASRYVNRCGDELEAAYREYPGRDAFNRRKGRYERALVRVGAARQALGL